MTGSLTEGTSDSNSSRIRDVSVVSFFAVAYFLADQLSFLFPDTANVLMAIWPAAGIGLAAFLLNPRRLWPAIASALFIAGNLANLVAHRSFIGSLGFMSANVIESLACAWLITSRCGDRVLFVRVSEVLTLLVAATFVNACTAVIGAGTALLVSGASFWSFWKTWWSADGLGLLIVTPIVVSFWGAPAPVRTARPRQVVELAAFLVVWCVVVCLTFYSNMHLVFAYPYLPFALLIWPALRMGQAVTVVALGILAGGTIALVGSGLAVFPWSAVNPSYHMFLTQFYLGCVAGTGMLLAASYAETRAAERAALKSEKRLDDIIFSMADWVWETDSNGVYTYSSAKGFEMFGQRREDVIGKTPFDFMPSDEVKRITPIFAEIMAKRAPIKDLENWNVDRDGRRICLLTNAVPFLDEAGNFCGYRGVDKDITQRKLTAESLGKSEEKFSKAFKASPAAITIASMTDGRYLDVNDAFLEVTGFQRGEVIGRTSTELNFWSDVSERNRYVEELSSKGFLRNSELRFRMRDGQMRDFLVSGEIIEIEGVKHSLNIILDITKRKQSDAALRESESNFRAMVESVPLAIVQTVGPDEVVEYLNPVMVSMFGYTMADIPTVKQWWPLAYPDEAYRGELSEEWTRRVKRAIETSSPLEPLEAVVTCKDGSRKNISWTFVTLGGRNYSFGIDLTERKQAEEREKDLRTKLERAARLESLGVLAGGVAHDLNNVLGPIVVLPDMVNEYVERHGDPSDPEHEDTLESMRTMKASALRAAAVVSDLVVMGRRGQFQQAPVDVNLVVAQMLDSKQVLVMQARRPDVQLVKSLTGEATWCLGSESRLVRVLVNLVGNAFEAIDGQGDVVVHTGRQVFSEVYHGYEDVPAAEYVKFEVTDTGCGMEAKTIARIFEPFFSTKAPSERSGSGLGLSVVHGLVKDHEGYLDVKSEAGKGTTFTVYLPAVDAGKVAEASVKNQLPCGCERILVVDDEPGQLVLSRRALKRLGYEVAEMSSGEESVALFESAIRNGLPAPFDLVITDMIMNEMDGLVACRTILKMFPGQKLIIASGHAPGSRAEESRALGIDWLAKPYTAADLARAVRARLDR